MSWGLPKILEFLGDAISDLKGNRKKLTAKEAFNKLFERAYFAQLDDDVNPSDPEAIEVIDKLTELVQAQKDAKKGLFVKKPELVEKRLQALKILREWLGKKHPENSTYFNGVNLNRLAIHLGLRVVKPRAIHQGDYGFCGPVTILYPLNKTEPEKYVNYVLGLVDGGIGVLGSRQIDVKGYAALLRYKRDCPIAEVDYVALASLRTEVGIALQPDTFNVENPNDMDSHATTPERMVQALRWAGYDPVENKTLADYNATRNQGGMQTAYDRLKQCEQMLRTTPGYAVIMLVHVALANYAKRDEPITGPTNNLKLGDLHWMVVKNLRVTGTQLTGTATMKVVTWGWSGLTDYPLKDFLPRFFGYLAADPSATASKASPKEFVLEST
jgi:hypothetical protein